MMKKIAKIFEQKIPKSKKLASKMEEILSKPFDKEAQKKDAGLKETKQKEGDDEKKQGDETSKTDTPKPSATEENKPEGENPAKVAQPE